MTLNDHFRTVCPSHAAEHDVAASPPQSRSAGRAHANREGQPRGCAPCRHSTGSAAGRHGTAGRRGARAWGARFLPRHAAAATQPDRATIARRLRLRESAVLGVVLRDARLRDDVLCDAESGHSDRGEVLPHGRPAVRSDVRFRGRRAGDRRRQCVWPGRQAADVGHRGDLHDLPAAPRFARWRSREAQRST